MDCRLIYGVTLVIGFLTLAVNGLNITSSAPVGTLAKEINRDTCGQRKVCLETPASCDPSSNDTCLFVSAATTSEKRAVHFELRGDSDSYIVLIVSKDMMQGNKNAFVCANCNGTNFFFTAAFDNGSLTVTNNTKVKNVHVGFKTNVVRCIFMVRELTQEARFRRINEPSFFIFAGNGSFANGVLGDPEILINGSVTLSNSGSDLIPVGALSKEITRDTCGQTKVCLETPASCDPSSNDTCLFVSAATTSEKRAVHFELRGDSDSYIVLIVSKDMMQGNKNAFVCANYKGTNFFFTAAFDNGSLTVTNNTKVKNVHVGFKTNVVRCIFMVRELTQSAVARRIDEPSFFIFAGNGSFANGVLGDPEILINGSVTLSNSGSDLIPVGALSKEITRDTCGQTKVCLETPASCDPSSNDTCLFVSAATTSEKRAVHFELRGDSDSYIVLIVSKDMMQGNKNAFVCANYKGTNFFFTAAFDNGSLTVTNNTKVKNVHVGFKTNVVRCIFMVRELTQSAGARRIDEPSFFIFAGNGSFANGVLGDPEILINGSVTLSNSGSDLIPVGALSKEITRDTCGQTKVCLETPASCDPSSNDTCLFVSAATTSEKRAVHFELRGDSDSYIVLIVSKDMMQGNKNAFVCANYKGTNFFFTAAFDNGSLTVTNNTKVKNVHVGFKTNVVRCIFMVRELTQKAGDRRIDEPSFFIFAGNGSFANGVLGDPEILINGSVTLSNSGSDLIPVGALSTAITRDGCGSTKYCNEVPADCNPSSTGECLFISAGTPSTTKTAGTKVNFEMRGDSMGYIAVILSTDLTEGGNDTTFVCAQSNNTTQFFTTTLNNGTLTRTDESEKISSVLASFKENVIRCTFSAQELNSTASTRRVTNDTSFRIFVANGTFINRVLGRPNILLSSNGTVNLADFTSNGSAGLHPASLALLVLLSLLISRLV